LLGTYFSFVKPFLNISPILVNGLYEHNGWWGYLYIQNFSFSLPFIIGITKETMDNVKMESVILPNAKIAMYFHCIR
jgi:hypothetical protein